jgi:hypothetical protein
MMIVNVARGARALARVSRLPRDAERERAGGEFDIRVPKEYFNHRRSRREKVNCGGSPLAAMLKLHQLARE